MPEVTNFSADWISQTNHPRIHVVELRKDLHIFQRVQTWMRSSQVGTLPNATARHDCIFRGLLDRTIVVIERCAMDDLWWNPMSEDGLRRLGLVLDGLQVELPAVWGPC